MGDPEVTASTRGVLFSWGSIAKALVVAASLGFTATAGWVAGRPQEMKSTAQPDADTYKVRDQDVIKAINKLGDKVDRHYERLNMAIERIAKLEGLQSKRSVSQPNEMSLLIPTMGALP